MKPDLSSVKVFQWTDVLAKASAHYRAVGDNDDAIALDKIAGFINDLAEECANPSVVDWHPISVEPPSQPVDILVSGQRITNCVLANGLWVKHAFITGYLKEEPQVYEPTHWMKVLPPGEGKNNWFIADVRASSRLIGREEFLAMLTRLEPETFLDDFTKSQAVADTGAFSVVWDVEKLQSKFACTKFLQSLELTADNHRCWYERQNKWIAECCKLLGIEEMDGHLLAGKIDALLSAPMADALANQVSELREILAHYVNASAGGERVPSETQAAAEIALAGQLAGNPRVDGTTSERYRAELYDEVWRKARVMGFANVISALEALERLGDLDLKPIFYLSEQQLPTIGRTPYIPHLPVASGNFQYPVFGKKSAATATAHSVASNE